MTSYAYDVPYLEGRVCYVDVMGGSPTVECYSRNLAFKFDIPKVQNVRTGDWLRFRGIAYVNTAIHKGQMKGIRPYLHQPVDGSPKEEWMFFFLTDVECKKIGPLDAIEVLRSCMNTCRRFVDNWEANDDINSLRALVASFSMGLDTIQPILKQKVIDEEEKRAPVKVIDLGKI